ADLREGIAVWADGLRQFAGSHWTLRAQREGRGDGTECDRRARSAGFHLGVGSGAGLLRTAYGRCKRLEAWTARRVSKRLDERDRRLDFPRRGPVEGPRVRGPRYKPAGYGIRHRVLLHHCYGRGQL